MLGRGFTLGRPVSILLSLKEEGANAAVTLLHTGVPDWADYTRAGPDRDRRGRRARHPPARAHQPRRGRGGRWRSLRGPQAPPRRGRALRGGRRLDHARASAASDRRPSPCSSATPSRPPNAARGSEATVEDDLRDALASALGEGVASGSRSCTVATWPARTGSSWPAAASSSRRPTRAAARLLHAPRRPACRGCGRRPGMSGCPRSSPSPTRTRPSSCSSGSTRAASRTTRTPRSAPVWPRSTGPGRRRSDVRTGARPAAGASRTSRARPGASSTPPTACCRWPASPGRPARSPARPSRPWSSSPAGSTTSAARTSRRPGCTATSGPATG